MAAVRQESLAKARNQLMLAACRETGQGESCDNHPRLHVGTTFTQPLRFASRQQRARAARSAWVLLSAQTDTQPASPPMSAARLRGNVQCHNRPKEDPMKKGPVDPALQGEGNYFAARRHRASVEKFVQSGKVQPAADAAAPHNAGEARALLDAEKAGRAPARK